MKKRYILLVLLLSSFILFLIPAYGNDINVQKEKNIEGLKEKILKVNLPPPEAVA